MPSKILTSFGKIMAELRVQVMTLLSPMATKFSGVAIISLLITLLSGSLVSGVEATTNSQPATTQLGLGNIAQVSLNPNFGQHSSDHPSLIKANSSLVDVLESNSSLKTFTSALKAAGLTETLKGAGPFTIFAPADQAFAKFPADALQAFLAPENKKVLVQVLKYHIVPGKALLLKDLRTGELRSLHDYSIPFLVNQGGVVLLNADSRILQSDIQGTNGVIHVVDTVLVPPFASLN